MDRLSKHLLRADPLHRGLTRLGVALGLTLSAGRWMLRPAGVYVLYVGPTAATATTVVGAAPAAATSIRPWPWVGQTAGRWIYRLEAVGAAGVAAVDDASRPPVVAVTVGSSGLAGQPAPPAPRRLRATAIAGGKIRLEWEHVPVEGYAAAAEWRVYSDAGTGVMDYNTAVATRRARASGGGAGHYAVETEAFAHATVVQIVVRARTAGGVEEANTRIASATADAEGPAGATIAAVSLGDDQ